MKNRTLVLAAAMLLAGVIGTRADLTSFEKACMDAALKDHAQQWAALPKGDYEQAHSGGKQLDELYCRRMTKCVGGFTEQAAELFYDTCMEDERKGLD